MTEKKKIEVNLEMCSGFFRIPTDDIIYNITILSANEPSTTKVVEKIIEVEKIVEVEKRSLPTAGAPPAVVVETPTGDDYYRQCARTFHQELAQVAREADNAPADSPGLDLGTIQDLTAMAADLKGVLLAMKTHPLLSGNGAPGGSVPLAPALSQLAVKIGQAQTLSTDSASLPSAQALDRPAKTVTRYLFDLDTVFQTIYELCTNETVKGHIQNARAKAGEIFDKDIFHDAISPKVSGYPEDDGFLTVPMTDIYTALGAACRDKAINNLLTKMDKQQASIFLDQFLPLEVPPREEITSPQDEGGLDDLVAPGANVAGSLTALLGECQTEIKALIDQGGSNGPGLEADDLITQVEEAITIAASIQADASRLATEGVSGQGGGPNPLWRKIKGVAILAETMLNRKEATPTLSYDDGLAAGQSAAQQALRAMPTKPKSPAPTPPKGAAAPKTPEPDNFGEASQDDIDRLLEELG